MRTMSSAEFRKTYPRLEEPVSVTAHGRIIGLWSPLNQVILGQPLPDGTIVETVVDYGPGMSRAEAVAQAGKQLDRSVAYVTKQTQAERDAILRRVNKGR